MKKGHLFIIAGPSAVGKTSVANEILKIDNSLNKIITCTTRNIRSHERNGIDYFFMTKEEFMLKVQNGSFIEYSEVYGNYYGILFSTVKEKITIGEDIILVINWEGFFKIKSVIHKGVIGFFIVPPSLDDLKFRIKSRGTDSEKDIHERLSTALEDIKYAPQFDFCFTNSDIIETSKNILKKINLIRKTS